MKHKAFYQQMLTCVLETRCNETAGATNLMCEQNSLWLTFYMQSLFSKHAASRLGLMQCRPTFHFHALNYFWLKQFQIQGYLSNFHWFKHAQEHVHIYTRTHLNTNTWSHIPNAWTHIHIQYSHEQTNIHKQPQHLITSGKNIVHVWWEP